MACFDELLLRLSAPGRAFLRLDAVFAPLSADPRFVAGVRDA